MSIELSFGEVDGAMELVVRNTGAIAQKGTDSSEIDQLDTQDDNKNYASTDPV
jgi:hypothetical protein